MVVRFNTTNKDYTYKPVLYNKCFQKREIPIYTSKAQLTTDTVVLSNNIPKSQKYELGEINNGYRIIDTGSVTISFEKISSAYNDKICSKEEKLEFEKNIKTENGEFNNFRQGIRGDCFLLSSIYSINQTKNGSKILKNNITYNKDGSVSVTLPGAIKAKKGYEEEGNGNKCAITGKYTITKEALERAKSLSGRSYSYGDAEVIITELAMEAYRAEVKQTNENLGQHAARFIPGQDVNEGIIDPLNGGESIDAIYILTGKKSEYLCLPDKRKNPQKVYIQGEYGIIKGNEFWRKIINNNYIGARKDEKEYTNLYTKDSDLQKLLEKYKGKEDEYAITVSVVNGQKAPDGTTKVGGGHSISVTKITDEYVEVINPWDTTLKERIPRDVFEKMAYKLVVAKM